MDFIANISFRSNIFIPNDIFTNKYRDLSPNVCFNPIHFSIKTDLNKYF